MAPSSQIAGCFFGDGGWGGEPDLAQGKRNSLQVYVSRTAYPTCQALRIDWEERREHGREEPRILEAGSCTLAYAGYSLKHFSSLAITAYSWELQKPRRADIFIPITQLIKLRFREVKIEVRRSDMIDPT